jgi:putative transposase
LAYSLRLPARDTPVTESMRRLSALYPRYGYRRIRIFLTREGRAMSAGRAERLWRQTKLQLPRKRPRRRVAGKRPRLLAPVSPNQVWAYDFVFDAAAHGQQIKCLTIVDAFTHDSLAIDVAGSIRSARVIGILSRLISRHGAPACLRSDNGPAFVSYASLNYLTPHEFKRQHRTETYHLPNRAALQK